LSTEKKISFNFFSTMSYRIQTKIVDFVQGKRCANWRKKQVNRELTPEQLASGTGAGASPSPVARCAERCSERAEPADLRPPPPAATFWIKPPLELESAQKHGIRTVEDSARRTRQQTHQTKGSPTHTGAAATSSSPAAAAAGEMASSARAHVMGAKAAPGAG
jgi:hypothetical protein